MYVFDNGVFVKLGNFSPEIFPTIWSKLDNLVAAGELISVRDIFQEMDRNFPFESVMDWAKLNKHIFRTPTNEELQFVRLLMSKQVGRELIKKKNILNGLPAADPFLIAAAKILGGTVVTQEEFKLNGARIPFMCKEHEIPCINLEVFFKKEGIKY